MSLLSGKKSKLPSEYAKPFKPQLTSLVDVMTVLTIFLIQSFSAEGIVHTVANDLKVPESVSRDDVPNVLAVEVTGDKIILADKLLPQADVATSDTMLIKPLYAALLGYKQSGSKKLLIQADRAVEFARVKKIMYSAGKAGFNDYRIMVMRHD